MAPLPARRALAPAAGAGAARPRGPGRRRGLLRRAGRRAVRDARRGAPPGARPARAGPARRPGPDAAPRRMRRLRDPARAGADDLARPCSTSGRSPGSATSSGTRPCSPSGSTRGRAVADVDDETLDRLIETARDLLRRSVATPPGGTPMAVYRRAGRPCRRCRTLVRSAPLAAAIPRTTYWCPACQPDERSDDGIDRRPV